MLVKATPRGAQHCEAVVPMGPDASTSGMSNNSTSTDAGDPRTGAVLILWPRIRPLAGWGLVALTIAVTPANVHMWLNPEQFPDVSPTLLSVRLVVQVFLLVLIWWSTRIEIATAE